MHNKETETNEVDGCEGEAEVREQKDCEQKTTKYPKETVFFMKISLQLHRQFCGLIVLLEGDTPNMAFLRQNLR